MITAAAASQLLICEIDRAVRGAAVLTVPARGGDGIGVCRSCRADIVQPAGENRAGEFNVESGEIEHYFTRRLRVYKLQLMALFHGPDVCCGRAPRQGTWRCRRHGQSE